MFEELFNDETDVFGLEISDLMVALVSVFLLGSVMMSDMITHFTGERSTNQGYVDSLIYKNIGAVATQYNLDILDNGKIRFRAPFESAESSLTTEMKIILDQLCPRLKKIVFDNKSLIHSITFEGHTSEDWPKEHKSTPYYGNKALSYLRAVNTMEYCLGKEFELAHPELMGKFNAFGFSYTRPILRQDGSVDKAASKRVDIVLRSYENSNE